MSAGKLFSIQFVRRNWELVPLVSIVGGASTLATVYGLYMLATKSDIMIDKSSNIPRWEKIDLTKPQVLTHYNTKYVVNPELEALRKEIGSYKC